ncbi:MAG: GntR family transcriptional regulator [Geminicoccaceae bacterium]
MAPTTSRVHKLRPGDASVAGATKNESLNDTVYRALKNEILLCRLQPGAETSEGQLAERYRFSKAPLRSALARLRQEKLVLTRGRLGNVIAPITIQDVREVFQLRLLLEIEATRMAAGRLDPVALKRLDARVRACHGADGDAPIDVYREANHEFHRYIVRAAGNDRLTEMVISLIEQHERIVHFSLSVQNRDVEFHHVHDDLVEALLDGDGDRAAELAERAIRSSQQKIMDSLLSSSFHLPSSAGRERSP